MDKRKTSARDFLRFFTRAGRLKAETRRGWVKKLGLEDAESVADHSYRTALMTMLISDSRGLDTERALRLALLHDLPEAVVGDAMPEERSGDAKIEVETKAMMEIVSDLPPKVRELYLDAWSEFLEGKSEEAKLVREMDKLEMAIQAWEYARDPERRKLAREFWESARKQVKDERLAEILELVRV
jgi:putative hydrolases of HD superfamily